MKNNGLYITNLGQAEEYVDRVCKRNKPYREYVSGERMNKNLEKLLIKNKIRRLK